MRESKTDAVKMPLHYMGDGSIEMMDAMRSMMTHAEVKPIQVYWWGCAFKYIWRWPWKNGRQDIMKAIQCLTYLLNCLIEEDEDDRNG